MAETLAPAAFVCAPQMVNCDPLQDTKISGAASNAIFSFLDSLQHAGTKTILMPDRYECIRVLGTGGMSTVYMARHKITDKVVAIKFMHPHLAFKGQNWSRFQREAKAAAKIYHPNVLSVYDCGVTTDGRPFLVMDYLEGTTLADVIARDGWLKPQRAVPLFLQICKGLESAHKNGVIHRDLKPGNVMIISAGTEQEVVRIVDFGIAKVLAHETGSGHLTQTGEVFGSPLYMSPEQCLGQNLDLRSDVYSMGCLMFETLTGKAPFVGETYMETMYKQMHEIVPNVCSTDRRGKIYRRLARIIAKALEKEPCDRYQTMEELQADLELALHDHPLAWLTDSRASKDACRRWHKAHRRQLALVWILIGVAILSIMTSASWMYVNNLLQGLDCVPDASKRLLLELWDKPAPVVDPAEAESRIGLASVVIRDIELKYRTQPDLYVFDLCNALESRGIMLVRNGLAFRGSRDFARALSLLQERFGAHCTSCPMYARLKIDLADYQIAIGQLDNAEAGYKAAIPALVPNEDDLSVSPLLSLARVEAMQGEYLPAAKNYGSVAENLVGSQKDRTANRFPPSDSALGWLAADCLSADCYRLAVLIGDCSNSGGATKLIRAAETRYQYGINWCKWDEAHNEADHHDSLAKLYWGMALLHAETGEKGAFASEFASALDYARAVPGARGYKLRAMILKAYTQSLRCHDPLKAAWLATEANRCWSVYKGME